MPSFRYKALSTSGEALTGVMEASSTDEVISKLQGQGHIPIEASPADGASESSLFSFLKRRDVTQEQVVQFTQQLSTLLGAGLALDRAMQIQVELAENDKVKRLLTRIRDLVRGGSSLSDALEAQHGVFNRLYINLVRAGEIGGTLDLTLARLTDFLKRGKQLKDSVISALIYPCILLVLAGGSLVFLLSFVIPRFKPIFENLGEELPLLTQIVMAMAEMVRSGWWVVAIALIVAVAWYRKQMSEPASRLRWDERYLKMAGFGALILKLETARFTRTLGTLMKNGVPLLTGLSISKNVLNNTVLANVVETVAKDVKTGSGLTAPMVASKRFPKLAMQMIAVGEETGQLDDMLMRVADTFDQDVKVTVDRLMALLVPALTITLAGFIMLIVLSMVMAIMQMNNLT
jgi:general secretion pathway protein F